VSVWALAWGSVWVVGLLTIWIGFGDGLVDLDGALFLFMVGHFMIGSVFADVFSFDALTDTL
jgi:hypothetical protein